MPQRIFRATDSPVRGGLYGSSRPTEPVAEEATVDGPARRRTSWSLKTIVEDVTGRPISELQDPDRPIHPYLRGKIPEVSGDSDSADAPYDPVDHLYPPLVGPTGRAFHGPAHEHHGETLERHRPLTDSAGRPVHPPGPSRRPERLYLHYLLLHMDRLSLTALRYLRRAVEEELAHRERPASPSRDSPSPTEDPASSPIP